MKRSRLQQPRLLRRDWVGDGIVTLLVGAVLAATIFLPWANEDRPGQVNYSLTMPDRINGILQTPWGKPELVLAIAAVCLGVAVILVRPRRFSWVLGVLIAACGAGVLLVGRDAAAGLGWWSPGLGMYLSVLAGVLLVPIGLATALVGWLVARAVARNPEAAPAPEAAPDLTAPPAPENAPPS